jgi:hypothetical protein
MNRPVKYMSPHPVPDRENKLIIQEGIHAYTIYKIALGFKSK